jgi:hypothetical protein
MSEFTRKYLELKKESLEFIKEFFIKNNITRYEFATQEEIESDNFLDTQWEYPQATYVGNMDYTYYYAITSITLEEDRLWFNGICVGEDSDEYNFGQNEVDLSCLCDSADLLTLNK